MWTALLLSTLTLLATLEGVYEARRQHDFPRALALLEDLRSRQPERYRLNDLPFLEAVVRQEGGDQAGARALLLELLGEKGAPLRDHLLLRLLPTLQDSPLAEQQGFWREFLEEYPNHPRWSEVAFRYADLLEKGGRQQEALAWFSRLSRGRGAWARSARLRQALLHLGDRSPERRRRGRQALERLLQQSTRDDVALKGARELHRRLPFQGSGEEDLRARAETFLNHRETVLARAYLDTLLQRYPGSPRVAEYLQLRARSLVVEGDFQAAVQAYQSVYDRFPQSSWGISSRYLVANTLLRKEDYEAALKVYRSIIEHHPRSQQAPNAYYNLVDALRWLGRRQEALEEARQALRQSPREERPRFDYLLARLYLDQESWSQALAPLQRLEPFSSQQLPSGVTREEIFFWMGFCLEQLGRSPEALQAYREALRGSPNYYSFQSRLRMERLAMQLAIPWVAEETHPEGEDSEWRDLIRSSSSRQHPILKGRPTFYTLQERELYWKETDSSQARLGHFLFLKLYREAYQELKRAPHLISSPTASLYYRAWLAEKGGLAAEAILEADRLRQRSFSGVPLEKWPAELLDLLYPRPYLSWIQEYAARYQVDPALLLAVMRRESRFQPDALSPASARGLMQFLLSTARALAIELGRKDLQLDDLYDPPTSIQLGAFYLSKLLKRFDGSLERALAAYNGGPENVLRWSRKSPRLEAPFFVADIGFRETKLYVLSVLGDYYVYKRLLAQEP